MKVGRAVIAHSEEETAAEAARFAAALPPGAVVLLFGELGAGKTAFVRGMAAGLGIDAEEVSSPTFTIIQEYRAAAPGAGTPGQGPAAVLYHVDLYRLEGGEVEDLGLEELAGSGGIVAIEWAERLPRPPADAVRVEIVDPGDDSRRIEISGVPFSRYSER